LLLDISINTINQEITYNIDHKATVIEGINVYIETNFPSNTNKSIINAPIKNGIGILFDYRVA
jgi:hypothetical protein